MPSQHLQDVYSRALELVRGQAPINDLLPVIGALTLVHASHVFPDQLGSLTSPHAPQIGEPTAPLQLDALELQLRALLAGRAPDVTLSSRGLSPEMLGRLSGLIRQGVQRAALMEAGPAGLQTVGDAFTALLDQASRSLRFTDYSTPASVAQLHAALLDVRPGMRLLDFALGHAQTWLAVAEQLRSEGLDPNSIEYVGQDANSELLVVAACHLLLHGITRFELHAGDALTAPATPRETFDRVVADPPFGLAVPPSGQAWELDLRFAAARSVPRTADWLFLLHGLAALAPAGRAVFTTVHGPLFRGGAERELRAVYLGWLNSVIALPSALYPGTGVAVATTVFDRPVGSPAPDHQVLMLDASNQGTKVGRYNVLPSEAVGQISRLVRTRAGSAEPAVHALVPADVLNMNDHAWQPNRYVPRPASQSRSLEDIGAELREAEARADQAALRLRLALDQLG